MQPSSRGSRGFTAIEATIVVFILGLLAAVAIPQIADGEPQAQTAELVQRLGQLRAAINRYWAQHDDFPGPCAGEFRRQLAGRTGRTGADVEGGEALGPYVADDVPASPITGTNTLTIVDAMPDAASGSSAWIYCRLTGEIRSNTSGRTDDGVRYFDL